MNAKSELATDTESVSQVLAQLKSRVEALGEELVNLLTEQALIYELKFEQLKLAVLTHLRELKIEPPTFLAVVF